MNRATGRGLTLIELMITIVMLAMVVIVTVYLFRAVLLSWSSQEVRTGVDTDVNMGVEQMRRDLMQAKDIDASVHNDELRFTTLADTYYIYYLYNASDSYPPDFGESSYELRKAQLSGVVGGDLATGTFSYGGGQLVMSDVLPPAASDLSFADNIVTADLSLTRNSETIRLRTEIKPRNLGL